MLVIVMGVLVVVLRRGDVVFGRVAEDAEGFEMVEV
jgi:hypothetical protein